MVDSIVQAWDSHPAVVKEDLVQVSLALRSMGHAQVSHLAKDSFPDPIDLSLAQVSLLVVANMGMEQVKLPVMTSNVLILVGHPTITKVGLAHIIVQALRTIRVAHLAPLVLANILLDLVLLLALDKIDLAHVAHLVLSNMVQINIVLAHVTHLNLDNVILDLVHILAVNNLDSVVLDIISVMAMNIMDLAHMVHHALTNIAMDLVRILTVVLPIQCYFTRLQKM